VIDSAASVEWLPVVPDPERVAGIVIANGTYYGYAYTLETAALTLVRWDLRTDSQDMPDEDCAKLEERFNELGLDMGNETVWEVWPAEASKMDSTVWRSSRAS
jgi:hypothetical protein